MRMSDLEWTIKRLHMFLKDDDQTAIKNIREFVEIMADDIQLELD